MLSTSRREGCSRGLLRDCTTSPINRLQPASPATTRSRAQLWSPPLPPTLRSPDIPRGVDNIEYLETIQTFIENVKFIQILIIPIFSSHKKSPNLLRFKQAWSKLLERVSKLKASPSSILS